MASLISEAEKDRDNDTSTMRVLNGDLLVYCLSFLNSIDTGFAKSSSRRLLYLLDKLGKFKPTLSVTSSSEFKPKETVHEALSGLTGEPNICFAFYSGDEEDNRGKAAWLAKIRDQLPRRCAILAAKCWSVQVNLDSELSYDKNLAISLGSFPEAKAVPFKFDLKDFMEEDEETTIENVKSKMDSIIPPRDDGYSVFVVYSMGNGAGSFGEALIKEMQRKNPAAAIIGGVCPAASVENCPNDSGDFFSMDKAAFEKMSVKELKKKLLDKNPGFTFRGLEKSELVDMAYAIHTAAGSMPSDVVEDGVCGIAIGGNCPLRSVVSRGMRSVTTGKIALPGDMAPRMRIKDVVEYSEDVSFDEGLRKVSTLVKPSGWVDESSSSSSSDVDGSPPIQWVMSMWSKRPQSIGVRNNLAAGFELHNISQSSFSMEDGTLLLEAGPEVVTGAEIDLFSMDKESLITDLDVTLTTLKSQLQGEEMLSALMFSCGARGPQPGTLPAMCDATRFEKSFTGLPLLGFYAGGEIGPPASVAAEDAFKKGKVAMQGMTAVFGVFIVPKRNLAGFDMNITADDHPDSWAVHCRDRLQKNKAK